MSVVHRAECYNTRAEHAKGSNKPRMMMAVAMTMKGKMKLKLKIEDEE